MDEEAQENRRKRRKLDDGTSQSSVPGFKSLDRPISPPPLKSERAREIGVALSEPIVIPDEDEDRSQKSDLGKSQSEKCKRPIKIIASPFHLTTIKELPADLNVDAVSLESLLGDPLIAECWNFNYLHDIDFLVQAFDPDVRSLVKIHVVHGFWKHEDASRLHLLQQAEQYANVVLHTAYMPEMFGTHHSKMLILIRHDDTAQVIIHTANMIPFDWTNMTQGVWKSPLLPKLGLLASPQRNATSGGDKFKLDLLNYLGAYESQRRGDCKSLIEELRKYDFSAIRAALVASVPGRHDVNPVGGQTSWGWAGLAKQLRRVPSSSSSPVIVTQISSIATLGTSDTWINKTFFKALGTTKNSTSVPTHQIVFPTADEVRRSINGYRSGSAIHIKIQSEAQKKQLNYLRPYLHHWSSDCHSPSAESPPTKHRRAGRQRAAPHIKTYARFRDSSKKEIEWMLLTSANLSKQAWGEAVNTSGKMRVSSYEIGVLIWPELLADNEAKMVPVFGRDTPRMRTTGAAEGTLLDDIASRSSQGGSDTTISTVIGARMCYNFPLVAYAKDEEPWCATQSYEEPDVHGVVYLVRPK